MKKFIIWLFFDGESADRRREIKIVWERPSVKTREFSVFVKHVEQPKSWWKSQLFILLEQDSILRQSILHEQMSTGLRLSICLTPNIFISISVELLWILLFDGFDGIFFADVHVDDFFGQSVDNSNSTFQTSYFANNYRLVAPPEDRVK